MDDDDEVGFEYGIEIWPNDEEMAEDCCCDHMLGQHEYGDNSSPCDICSCRGFHIKPACGWFYRCPSYKERK